MKNRIRTILKNSMMSNKKLSFFSKPVYCLLKGKYKRNKLNRFKNKKIMSLDEVKKILLDTCKEEQ